MAEPVATWWRSHTLGRYGASDDWRAIVPARHLPGAGPLLLGCDSLDEQRGDTAIWTILGGSATAIYDAIQEQRRQGLRVLVDLDDAAIDASFPLILLPTNEMPSSLMRLRAAAFGATATTRTEWRRRHADAIRAADGLIVSTAAVACSYAHLNANAFVCPNSVDPDDWPDPVQPDDETFRIGFAGGHVGRVEDLELIRPALAWTSEQPDVEVVLLGTSPVKDLTAAEQNALDAYLIEIGSHGISAAFARHGQALASIAKRKAAWAFRYRQIAWTDDLHAYRRNLAVLDVGLCPTIPTDWNIARSDSKALDYAMMGVLPICSDVEPYEPWRGGPMPLARDADDFLELVRWCVTHRDEVRALAHEAREYVLRERTIENNIHRWREACEAPATRELAAAGGPP
jgi:glycosyltransferase involved in cell wall biosynthesis